MTRSTFRGQQTARSRRAVQNGGAKFPYLAQQPSHTSPPQFPTTNHYPLPTIHCRLDGRAVPALPCAGGHPPQRPPAAMPPCARVPSWCVSDREAIPPCVRAASLSPTRRGHDATVSARRHSIPRPTGSHRPHRFASATGYRPLATGHWHLSTIHYRAAIRSRRPLQEFPKRAILQGRARTQSGWTRTRRITQLPAHHAQAANHVDLPRTERPNPAPSELRSGLCR